MIGLFSLADKETQTKKGEGQGRERAGWEAGRLAGRDHGLLGVDSQAFFTSTSRSGAYRSRSKHDAIANPHT